MKRSAQIVLVVMAATGVGATSYALMPREDCARNDPGAPQSDWCRTSRGSGGHGGSSYSSSSSSRGSSTSSSAGSPASFVGGTERGGFGGFARSIGAHFSGG